MFRPEFLLLRAPAQKALCETVPDDPDWFHEVKYDGYAIHTIKKADPARIAVCTASVIRCLRIPASTALAISTSLRAAIKKDAQTDNPIRLCPASCAARPVYFFVQLNGVPLPVTPLAVFPFIFTG